MRQCGDDTTTVVQLDSSGQDEKKNYTKRRRTKATLLGAGIGSLVKHGLRSNPEEAVA